MFFFFFFFFQAEDGIRDLTVTGVQTCALPISTATGIPAGGLDLVDPMVVIGFFVGGCIPFFIAAVTMTAVGRAAEGMVAEVRRQFREIPGLVEGRAKPDSARCVDISTRAALREMIVPGLTAVLAPVVVGRWLGIYALGGMLAGATLTGVLLALFMANAGGAWDNAKKHIEAGAHGGKGSDPHRAAVGGGMVRSEEHTSELQSQSKLGCR